MLTVKLNQKSSLHISRKELFVWRIPVDGFPIRWSPRRVLDHTAAALSVTRGKRGWINYKQQTSRLLSAERSVHLFSFNRIQSAKTKNNKWTSKTFKNMRNWQNRLKCFYYIFSLICHFQWHGQSDNWWPGGSQTEEAADKGQLREADAGQQIQESFRFKPHLWRINCSTLSFLEQSQSPDRGNWRPKLSLRRKSMSMDESIFKE